VRRRPPTARVLWRRSFRIIPTRYPPIALFERIADPADWDDLLEIESLTNDRIRDEVGEIRLVAPEERVSGPGATWVMGTFTHIGRPTRFSDGSYGVYYAARTLDASIAESAYHAARFFSATAEPAAEMTMRVLVGGIDAVLHDLRRSRLRFRTVFALDDYSAAQALARELHASGSNGIVYPGVRLAGSECVAAFRPRVVRPMPRHEGHLRYHWDGTRVDRYWDYATEEWTAT